MADINSWVVEDLKLVYRVLHAHLMEHAELMDSEFFSDLQRFLQGKARAEGVNLADHAAWDEWLGVEGTPCDVRMQGRRTIDA